MNMEEAKEQVLRMQREILGEASDITEEARTNLRTITLAAIPYMNRGIPLVDIVKAVNKQWDKFLERADELHYARDIGYWGARARALAYAKTRGKFQMPADGPTVSYPEVYEFLPRHVMDFLKSIDTDETTLVVSDCDKLIYRHKDVFMDLREFLLMETHHMRVRVGGNSHRFAGWLRGFLIGQRVKDMRRFEFFMTPFEDYPYTGKRTLRRISEIATVRFVGDYKFDLSSEFMRYVDRYDIRGSGSGMNFGTKTITVYGANGPMSGSECIVMVPSMMSNDTVEGTLKDGTVVRRIPPELGLRGSMATLWVRNEQSGFLHNGEFHRFNDSLKGAWAIADVMMAKGYEDIPPATHALYSDSWTNLAHNERKLFADAGLVCHHLLRSHDEADDERRKYAESLKALEADEKSKE